VLVEIDVLLWIVVVGALAFAASRFLKTVLQNRVRAAAPAATAPDLEALTKRVELLEARIQDRDESLRKLQEELRFVTRMLEEKTPPADGPRA
jgi:hypothetical protein